MNKQDKIKEYNNKNVNYFITNIKRMSQDEIDSYKTYGKKSLYELYNNPSDLKVNSWNEIVSIYMPIEIIGVQGSCFTYSVLLKDHKGDVLHITKDNNYLVEVTA